VDGRGARAIVAAVASVVLVSSLSGCAYTAEVRAGQEKVDRAIARAGLADDVTGEYSCTGALPFQADTCSTHLDVASDDLKVLERVGEVPLLADADVDLIYRGITFHTSGSRADDVRRFEPFITNGLVGGSVTVDDNSADVRLGAATGFQQICDQATNISEEWETTRVSSPRLETTHAYWEVEAVALEKPALYDSTCALLDDFVATLGVEPGFGYALYQTDRDRVLLSTDKRSFGEADATALRDRITDWVASHEIPRGLTIDVY